MLTAEWLLSSSITRLVLAIKSVETDETLERWQFDIHTEESAASNAPLPGGAKPPKKKEKTEKDVQGEIREIMKQITSSVTFLPILEEECESGRGIPGISNPFTR
jgi:mitotic spindle assembly checkpoint protein MAD2